MTDKELHNPEFLNLVLECLNIQNELSLSTEILLQTNGSNYTFDLADIKRRSYVEIINVGTASVRKNIEAKLLRLTNIVAAGSANNATTLYVVFEKETNPREIDYYRKIFAGRRIKYVFLNQSDIIELARHFQLTIPNSILEQVYDPDDRTLLKDQVKESNEIRDIGYTWTEDLILLEKPVSFWWINASRKFFKDQKASLGTVYRYPILTRGNKSKPRFGNLKVGDLLIGYDAKGSRRIYGLLVLVKKTKSEAYLKVIYLFENKITWSTVSNIAEFKGSSLISSKVSSPLNQLKLNQFNKLITRATTDVKKLRDVVLSPETLNFVEERTLSYAEEAIDEIPDNPFYTGSSISIIDNDNAIGEDYLGISDDVDAFAKVIASNSLAPPLSIALFGRWGSGKSFFMDKLKERVNNYVEDRSVNSPFCSNVIHIHFNAWSYLDANLWASFASIIFENIFHVLEGSDPTSSEIKTIYNELKNDLLLVHEHEEKIQIEIERVGEEKTEIIEQIGAIRKKLEKVVEESKTFEDSFLRNELLKQLNVKAQLQEAIQTSEFKGVFELSEEAYENIELFVLEVKKFRRSSGSIFTNRFITWFVVIILLVGILAFAMPIILERCGLNQLSSLFPQVFVLLFGVVIPILGRINRVARKVLPIIQKANNLIAKRDERLEEKRNQLREQILQHESQKIELEVSLRSLLEKQIEAKQKIKNLEEKLDGDLTHETIKSIIRERHLSSTYKKHLGLVSMLRSDFQLLSTLFVDHRDKRGNEIDIKDILIDRIVLYIDDLDRCAEDRVIQVLEAVNLLLAFPLFVVIVGVDHRWVKNALVAKHQKQFDNKSSDDYERIDASDYLEKIFQIPFHLKKASSVDVSNMIARLINDSRQEPLKVPIGNNSNSVEEIAHPVQESVDVQIYQKIGEEETPPDSDSEHQLLKLDDFEIKCLPELEFLLGSNPRAIKRFINIYRVVRTHGNLVSNSSENRNTYHLATMFIVALSVGEHKDVFQMLVGNCQAPFGNFIDLEHLFSTQSETDYIRAKLTDHENLSTILKIEYSILKPIVLFTSRFSFSLTNSIELGSVS